MNSGNAPGEKILCCADIMWCSNSNSTQLFIKFHMILFIIGRASMSPTFSTSKLKLMTNIMERCTNNTVEVLDKKCESSSGVFTAKE